MEGSELVIDGLLLMQILVTLDNQRGLMMTELALLKAQVRRKKFLVCPIYTQTLGCIII